MSEALVRLARRNGIQPIWRDAWGQERHVAPDVLAALLRGLGVPADDPAAVATLLAEAALERVPNALPARFCAEAGEALTLELAVPAATARARLLWQVEDAEGERHAGAVEAEADAGPDAASGLWRVRWRLVAPRAVGHGRLLLDDGRSEAVAFSVAPARCHDALQGRRAWGAAVQLPGMAAPGADGFGHYAGLATLAAALGGAGADAIATSPMHALFAADAGHFSPYAPSDRRFLNGLLADPSPWLAEGAAAAAGGPLIDWTEALPRRRRRLRAAWDRFAATHLAAGADGLGAAFLAYRAERGAALENHARFEALHARLFGERAELWDWRAWPVGLRHPASPEVEAFARAEAHEVGFHVFLQWLAERQLAAAQAAARAAGMAVGLIADLAVGTHPGGGRAWSEPGALLAGLSIGAPPDLLGPLGQDWGLTTLSPAALRRDGCASFLADLRAAMRHAGGIRLDHIMGLRRLWCVPAGARPDEGAYLEMPWRDLSRLVALESHLNRCIVVGEDLGTLPDGFRDELRARNLLGIQVLWFERDADGGFLPPERYSDAAVATTSTHDLPTLAGWWLERDIDWRARIGHLRDGEAEARAERARDRAALWRLLHAQGLAASAEPPRRLDGAAAAAIATLLARSPAPLLLLPLEDLLLAEEQPNLPGTVAEHPNWRRRLGDASGGFLQDAPAAGLAAALKAARPRP